MRRLVSRMMLLLLATSAVVLAFETRTARADGAIYINADGNITPATAPISTFDNITYTLNGKVNESIVVRRGNIILDGSGYAVQGSGSGNGIDLELVSNVTVENASVSDFSNGFWLNASSNDVLSDNTLTGNSPYGVYILASSNDTLTGNQVTGNYQGIVLDSCSNNMLQANDVEGDPILGIGLYSSSNNTLSSDNVTESNALGGTGIHLSSSPNNTLMGNNVVASYDGLILETSTGNVLSQNHIQSSVRSNFGVYGGSQSDYTNSVDASNLADRKPIYYIVNQNGLLIDSANYPSVGYLGLVNCTGITVENLTLVNIEQEGLLLAYATNCTITQNNIINNRYGVYLFVSSSNMVSGNNLTAANQYTYDGIDLESSTNNTIFHNKVTGNGEGGIHLDSSSGNIVSGNNFTDNHGSIGLLGSWNNTLSGNYVSGSASWGMWLLYSFNNSVSGNTLTRNNFMGIGTTNSFGDTVSDNNASGNYDEGIYIYEGSFNETVSNNNASGNTNDGIAVDGCSNVTVSGNNVTENGEYGIALYSTTQTCTENTVVDNNVVRNGNGIFVDSSVNNTIYHNNFINNTRQTAIINSEPNIWDDGYPSGGNFWGDYNGTDVYTGPYQNVTGSDGIGDTPYVVDANNTDHYPLIVHDLAVTGVVPSKTVVGRGYSLNVTVAAADLGNVPEMVNATVYANTALIASDEVTLQRGNSVQIKFTWNTTAFPYGNYTISAYALPVQNETNTGNSNMTSGAVCISIPGDINGNGTVDAQDSMVLINAFGTTLNNSNWNPNADINGDGIVDILDAIIFSNHFLQQVP
jgi:parallel beta-helix repeat protein